MSTFSYTTMVLPLIIPVYSTIPHEGSHFTQVKGTQDYAYGEADCKSLARSSPTQASNNAE